MGPKSEPKVVCESHIQLLVLPRFQPKRFVVLRCKSSFESGAKVKKLDKINNQINNPKKYKKVKLIPKFLS